MSSKIGKKWFDCTSTDVQILGLAESNLPRRCALRRFTKFRIAVALATTLLQASIVPIAFAGSNKSLRQSPNVTTQPDVSQDEARPQAQ